MNELETSRGVSNPLVLIQAAIDKGIEPDQLGKLLDLQERWERNRAAEAFAEALTSFQAECPTVFKGRHATGKLTFAFASFDDVMREAGPILARYRIAVTFTTEPADKAIKVTCRVRVGIHAESTTLTLPIPEGVVNNTQLFGQAVSYGKRYALCAALNIVVTDEDNDARGCLDTLLTDEVDELKALIDSKGVDLGRFLAWAQVESLDQILRCNFAKAMDLLRRKKPNGGKS